MSWNYVGVQGVFTQPETPQSLNKPANNLRQVWWEQLAASLLTTCSKSVDNLYLTCLNKLMQAMRTHLISTWFDKL